MASPDSDVFGRAQAKVGDLEGAARCLPFQQLLGFHPLNNVRKLEWGCAGDHWWYVAPQNDPRKSLKCARSPAVPRHAAAKRAVSGATKPPTYGWATYADVLCKRVILSKVAILASGRLAKPDFDQLAGSPLTVSML